jgi:WD40 repeat protein
MRMWDAKSGAAGRVVRPAASGEVVSLAWNRKGGLAAIHDNDTLTIVPADAQALPTEIEIKTRGGSRLAWADDERTAAVPLRDGRVALLDTAQSAGEPTYLEAPDVKDEGWGIAVRPSDRTLFASYTNGDIRLWDLTSQKLIATLANTNGNPRDKVGAGSLSLSPDGRLLATSGGDRFVTVYDIARRATWRTLATDANETRAVAFSPDGRRLAALGADDRLYVWDLAQDAASRYVAVAAVPGRASVGDASKRAEHASWLDWLSNDRIAIATGSAALTVVELDAAKWRKRIDGLASAPGASVK